MTNETTTKTTTITLDQLTDEHRIAKIEYGQYGKYDLAFWDDGWGPLWIYRETLGPRGVVRARTWEEAYECVIDEIMDDADAEYLADPGYDVADGDLPEGCHYRSNGVPSNPRLTTAIAQEDANGSRLDRLTPELATEYGIVIHIDDEEAR